MMIRTRLIWLSLVMAGMMSAQTPFSSGSTGADGDLTFPNAKSGDTVIFNPADTTLFPNGLDPEKDNIFHFKSITIPAGVTVRLTANFVAGPVTWLAQGDVKIDGLLDLSGENGGSGAGTLAVPGPGGFHGGRGGEATAGFGPAGGSGGVGGCNSGYPRGGGFTGNQFLVPLVGGSGGGGVSGDFLGGGGAGGGAILIASSRTISVVGEIRAKGGACRSGHGCGPGAGGAIRLMANVIQGGGTLAVDGSVSPCSSISTPGLIRLEAVQNNFLGSISGKAISGTPYDTFATLPPVIRVLTVAGVPVKATPTGGFVLPDVTINNAAPVPVVVETTDIPAGTVMTLSVYPESGAIQSYDFPAIAGNGPKVQTTVNVTWPAGFAQGFVRAKWQK